MKPGFAGTMTPRFAAAAIIAAGTLLRLAVAAPTGIRNLGDYIVVVSRQLPLATIDHPPMMFWIVGLWTRLTGTEDAFVVRLPFIALFAASSWLLFRLTALAFRDRGGEWAGVWAVAMFNLSAIFGVVMGVWIFPDGPLIFFLLLAAICVARVVLVTPAPANPLVWWLTAGLAAGGAMLSKYTAVFLFVGVLAFLLTVSDARRFLRTRGPWLGVLIAAICFLPAAIWNAEHDWASFAFQGARALPGGGVNLWRFGESIVLQIAVLLPWIFVPLVVALAAGCLRGPGDRASWFFVCLALGPIVFFTALTLVRPGFPHWSMPGWLFAFPLLGHMLASTTGAGLVWAKRAAAASAIALTLLAGGLIAQAATGVVGRFLPGLAPGIDPAFLVRDWPELAPALADTGLAEGRFVAAPDWETAAAASYALGPGVPVVCLCDAEQHFKYLQDRFALAGRDAFIVGWPNTIEDRMGTLAAYFETVTPLPRVPLMRDGHLVADLAVVDARGFRPGGR